LYHLSYGMVDLPSGKMKSREGTSRCWWFNARNDVQLKKISEDLGKLDSYSRGRAQLYNTIGLGALKYYILKVDPKRESLKNLLICRKYGPFIQYTYARIQSIIRKANFDFSAKSGMTMLHEKEKVINR
jgi:arginyl-tRNA synthetase